jgi:predicted transcriptional regulator
MPEESDRGRNTPAQDQRLVRALEHPVRVGFLKLLAERGPLGVAEALKLLQRDDLGHSHVAYHVRVLNLFGLVEPAGDPTPGGSLAFAATPAGEDAAAALGLPPPGESGE